MKLVRTTLLSVAGVILALGLTAAQAQTAGSDVSPGGPVTPEVGGGGPGGGAPSGGEAGTMGEGQGGAGAGATAPEVAPSESPGKAAGQTDQMKPESAEGAADKGKAAKKDTVPSEAEAGKAGGTAETKEKPGTTAEGKAGAKTDDKADMKTEGKTGATAEGDTKVEGKAGKSVRLESQQVGKVKTYFSEHRPSVKAINKTEVSVSVGVALPGTIALYDLPPDIIVVEGGCPIKYFVWGDDIVLVDSCTRHVVEIIVGVA